MSAITPEPILNIATGFMGAKQLFAASEIGFTRPFSGVPKLTSECLDKPVERPAARSMPYDPERAEFGEKPVQSIGCRLVDVAVRLEEVSLARRSHCG
jgi:hypothetical protein